MAEVSPVMPGARTKAATKHLIHMLSKRVGRAQKRTAPGVLLSATLRAHAEDDFTDLALDRQLESTAWAKLREIVSGMAADPVAWDHACGSQGLPPLLAMLERVARTSHVATHVLCDMHDAMHAFVVQLVDVQSGIVLPDSYRQKFDPFLRLAARIHALVPATNDDEKHLACRVLLYMADIALQGWRGTSQLKFPRSSPDIPLEVCLSADIAIMPSAEDADVYIRINRHSILTSSFAAVMAVSRQKWASCQLLDVVFEGESGHGEGVMREWLTMLAHALFHESGLFVPCPDAPNTVHPRKATTHIDRRWMNFAGRVLALGVMLTVPLGVHLSQATLSVMTMRRGSLADLQELQPEVARSLACISRADAEEFAAMGISGFCAPNGQELFPGGGSVAVTVHNRAVYVDMVIQHLLYEHLDTCLHVLDGMMQVISTPMMMTAFVALSRMTAGEFNSLVGGEVGDISADEWQAHTAVQVVGSRSGAAPPGDAGQKFFPVVHDMSQHDRRALLRFWTGLRSLPSGGFGRLPCQLQLVVLDDALPGRFPCAHTCFMSLKVPGRADPAVLQKNLHTAIRLSMEIDDDDDVATDDSDDGGLEEGEIAV